MAVRIPSSETVRVRCPEPPPGRLESKVAAQCQAVESHGHRRWCPGARNGERPTLLSLLSESKAQAMAPAAHLVQAGCGVADTLERLATPDLVPLPLPLAVSDW